MDQGVLELLRDALAEHEDPRDAARSLAAEPERLTIRWRSFLQEHQAEVLDSRAAALTGIEALHVACLAVGIAFEQEHVPAARENDDARVNVLRRLWGLSLEAAGEIILLLRTGYHAGASARWRLLREADVLSLFVLQQPTQIAQEFLDHTSFKGIQVRWDYQRWARSVGAEEISRAEMSQMKDVADAILDERPHWAGDYGWAHDALLDISPDYAREVRRSRRLRGPTFADLEAALGQRPSKLWYALASESVHARIDTVGDEPLRGFPSVDDIGQVGALTAQALPVPTAALIGSWPTPEHPDPEFLRFAKLLFALADDAADSWS